MTTTAAGIEPTILLYALRHALGKKKLAPEIEQAVRDNLVRICADEPVRRAMVDSVRDFHFWPGRPDLHHWLTIIDLLEGRPA